MEVPVTWKDVDHPKYQFSQFKVLFFPEFITKIL